MKSKIDNRNNNDMFVLSKYRHNIDIMVDRVSIFPKDYRKRESVGVRWKVYINYMRDGSPKQLCMSSYYINSQKVWVNKIRDHRQKVTHIHNIRDLVIRQLKTDPKMITSMVHGYEKAKLLYPEIFSEKPIVARYISIERAFEDAYSIKAPTLSRTSDIRSVKNRFLSFIGDARENDISLMDKKMLVAFLDSLNVSNKTYNGIKADLSTLLSVMVDRDIISKNYLFEVKNLRTKPALNKAFTHRQVTEIFAYLKENDPLLHGYCMHVYHGLMRPVTVNRLRVRDVDLRARTFSTRTKTFDFIKIITDTLYNGFYKGLEMDDPDSFIFGYNGTVQKWDANDRTRQTTYGKRFAKVKKKLGIDSEHTIYSFRHSAIARIFETKHQELKAKGVSGYKLEAVKFIMPFLNHTNERTTLRYLRGISTLVHVD